MLCIPGQGITKISKGQGTTVSDTNMKSEKQVSSYRFFKKKPVLLTGEVLVIPLARTVNRIFPWGPCSGCRAGPLAGALCSAAAPASSSP